MTCSTLLIRALDGDSNGRSKKIGHDPKLKGELMIRMAVLNSGRYRQSPRRMSNNYFMLSQMPINGIFIVPSRPGIVSKGILLFNTVLKFLTNTVGKLDTANTLHCTAPRNMICISLCNGALGNV